MENETQLKLIFWIGTSIMLLMALGFLIVVILYYKKVYRIRQKESENLLKTSFQIEKRERKRIASDLHDGIIGDLNAVRNYVSFLYTKEFETDKKNVLEDIKSSLDNTLVNIQNISYNLMPPLLDSFGLIHTLTDYLDRVKKWNNIDITTQYLVKNIIVSDTESHEIYRIVQELISNMTKHGNVSKIDFRVEKEDNKIKFILIDNGISFDFYTKLKDTHGMGLKSITSRCKQIGAELEKIHIPQGNKIIISLKNTIC